MKTLYAVVIINPDDPTHHVPLPVTELTIQQMDDLGCYGCERLARDWAEKGGFHYVDFAT